MRLLTGFPSVFACFVATSVLVPGTEAKAVVFNDGLLHNIDAANSFPFESVQIFDEGSLSPGPPTGGAATTVNLVDGGKVGTGLRDLR